MPVRGAQPVRRFSWSTSQFHRPGLQYMVSTGRHHGFESHAEQQLLLALDFAGELIEVLSQPFRLTFISTDGSGDHIPDFLAVTRAGSWLIDVRPGERIKAEDRVRFAAASEAALSCGWRYAVVPGWRPHVQETLDTVSAQRRPLTDPLGLQPVLLATVRDKPVEFGALAGQTGVPAMARAQALHLIWDRCLGVDLAAPLTDRSLVHAGRSGR
ncbi:MAG TPA: TnsA-like heteromeric transposase endonuclease subunit [Streptosporangiaceae bacterium]|nr:TnsA-like heteromeric transposase endonuclease subunit [Streptosporangiaceae bacterium]